MSIVYDVRGNPQPTSQPTLGCPRSPYTATNRFHFQEKTSLLDNAPNYLVGYVIQKRSYFFLTKPFAHWSFSFQFLSVLLRWLIFSAESQLVGDFYPTCVKLGAQGRKSFDPKLSCVISEMDIDNRYRRTYFSEIRIVVGIMGIRIQDLR